MSTTTKQNSRPTTTPAAAAARRTRPDRALRPPSRTAHGNHPRRNSQGQRSATRPAGRKTLRAEQVAAVDAVVDAIAEVGSRTQLLRACGTGKTLVMERVAERYGVAAGSGRSVLVVFAAPTITLVNQTVAEWRNELGDDMPATLAVFSDELDLEPGNRPDDAVSGADDWQPSSTTAVNEIVTWLAEHHASSQLIVSTHASLGRVVDALRRRGERADLLFVDEAHRLAGVSKVAAKCLAKRAPFDRFVFATATPRIVSDVAGDGSFTYLSMDDVNVFGEAANTYSFRAAIEDGVLCDYQVVVVAVTDDDLAEAALDGQQATLTVNGHRIVLSTTELVSHLAVNRAVREYDLRKMIAFNSRVTASKQWARNHLLVTKALGCTGTAARHLDGGSQMVHRRQVLGQLAGHDGDGAFVLSNVRLLTEGVDVPSVDAVAFLAPRRSEADVVQIVGRALRVSPGKACATIVLPVYVPGMVDESGQLHPNVDAVDWTTVIEVVRRLRTFDEALAEQLDLSRAASVSSVAELADFCDKVTVIGADLVVDAALADAIRIRLVELTTESWWERYGALAEWVAVHGSLPRSSGGGVDETKVGRWVAKQRHTYQAGGLSEARIRRLETLPGWSWVPNAGTWEDNFAAVAGWLAHRGVMPRVDCADPSEVRLGRWVVKQRQTYRTGRLSDTRKRRLEALPGWVWATHPDWDVSFTAVARWFATAGAAPRGRGGDDEETRLGVWVKNQRQLHKNGKLDVDRVRQLESIPGWAWDKTAAEWDMNYGELARLLAGGRFPRRSGGDAAECRLAQWANKQRHAHKRGKLLDERCSKLGQLPGWQWSLG